jgi:hypothetical protein
MAGCDINSMPQEIVKGSADWHNHTPRPSTVSECSLYQNTRQTCSDRLVFPSVFRCNTKCQTFSWEACSLEVQPRPTTTNSSAGEAWARCFPVLQVPPSAGNFLPREHTPTESSSRSVCIGRYRLRFADSQLQEPHQPTSTQQPAPRTFGALPPRSTSSAPP